MQPSDRLFSSAGRVAALTTGSCWPTCRARTAQSGTVSSFTDARIQMLVRNTERVGCGLVMIGGANSFGAGGWTNTPLEKAMPVDFQIKNDEGRADRRPGDDDARQRNRPRQLLAEGDCPGSPQVARPARLLRHAPLGSGTDPVAVENPQRPRSRPGPRSANAARASTG